MASSSESDGATTAARPYQTNVQSALPSPLARALAFLAIVVAGLCGGLIGYAFTDLSCSGDCDTWLGIGALVGAVIAAVGVAIVAILTLRAMDEWESIRTRDGQPPTNSRSGRS